MIRHIARFEARQRILLKKVNAAREAVLHDLANQSCDNLLCMATQAGYELCSRCGHERDSHGPDCRAETSDRRYMYLCPCIAFVPPKEPNPEKKSSCKQVTH